MSRIFVYRPYSILIGAMLALVQGPLAAQGLTARIAPEYSAIGFGESVGLEDARFLGAGAGMGFGRYVVLRAAYQTASMQTALERSGYGAATDENGVDASLFTSSVQLRLGAGRVAPVLLGGGGVIAFSPDGREDVRQIAATYGGGVDARLTPWLDGQLLVHPVRFRFDRATVAADMGGGPPVDPQAGDLRSSLALSASLGARVGGSRSSTRADALDSDMGRALQGGEGFMVPFEFLAGGLRFAEGLAIDDQALAGVRAGLDFGPYFGVRGSYSRGVSGSSLVGMSSWTGEAQFNVGKVTGVSPHLLLGYGGLSFWGTYLDDNGLLPSDQNALIVGGGLGVPLSPTTRFLIQLRDHITTSGSVSGVSSTSDLQHNIGLSAGLSFTWRGRRQVLQVPGSVVADVQPRSTGTDVVAATSPTTDTAVRPAVSDSAAPMQAVAATETVAAPGESVRTPTDPSVRSDSATVAAAVSYQSDRVLSIPIPTQGELYIRYGPTTTTPSTVSTPPTVPTTPLIQAATARPEVETLAQDSAIALLVRQEVATLLASTNTVTRNDLDSLEAGLAGMLRSEVARRESASATALTREDLASVENRLAAQFAAILEARAPRTDQDVQRSAELAALSAQVDALSALVRERSETAPPAPVVVVSSGGEAVDVPGGSGAPFLRGAQGMIGTASVRDGGPGFGARAEVMVGELFSGRLQPHVGVQIGSAGVEGSLTGVPYGGSVLSVGGSLGVSASLPRFRSLAPELNVGVVGMTGGVSGDSPPEADVMETIYGGLVMGPRVALDATWVRSEQARFSLAGTIARTWAGARGGWNLQLGMRWQRPFTRRATLFATTPRETIPVQTSATEPSVPQSSTDSGESAAAVAAAAQLVDSTTLSRIAELERALEEERAGRRAMTAASDSAARVAAARADSVERAAMEETRLRAAAAEEEAVRVAARRAALRAELEALLGVVEDVQAVRETARGLEVVVGGGVFPINSVDLEGAARTRVLRVATILSRAEGYTFLVDGHTDSSGSGETNRTVSEARAQAVRAVLISSGIAPQRIDVLASGEDSPVADNATREGRARNRRVEIVVIGW